MSQPRIYMKKLRELIRLNSEADLKNRQLGSILNVSASTVSYYLRAIKQAELTWPLSPDLSDSELLKSIEPYCKQIKKPIQCKQEIDWEYVHGEMKRKHVTLILIYQELKEQMNDNLNYSYSHFCRQYKKWTRKKQTSMVMTHEYGDKVFIDYAGDTIPLYSKNGEAQHKAQVYIAVLGGSKYTYATATLSQKIPDWISANVQMLEFFGGVPALLVPDNLRSAIKDSCKYEPLSNPSYAEFAAHYNTAILPARSYKPKDKALAENGVLIVERWIMARLRKQKFYSLMALNNAIYELVAALNNKSFQKKSGSRASVFKEHEQSCLKPLPPHRYETAIFRTVKVQKNYHVCIDNHYYSVPYQLVSLTVECRITNNTIEVFDNGQRVTSHPINKTKGEFSTLDKHMPDNHREHKNWSTDIFLAWAKQIGTGTYNLATEVIKLSAHKDKSYRFHLGLKKLAKQYSNKRLDNACLRALASGCIQYKSVSSILRKKLDLQPCLESVTSKNTPLNHSNIRGKNYFKQQLRETTQC